jgi:tetratricopeptide (TPR) repeat protein
MRAMLLGALLLLPASAARAQEETPPPDPPVDPSAEAPDPRQQEAQSLFRRGVELGAEDRWSEALEHFRRSREIAPRPNTTFNIGYALFRLERFSQAIAAFDEYLEVTVGETSERRDEATRMRAEAVASLAEIRLDVSPDDARVLVDGEPGAQSTGSPRLLPVDPGRHVVIASRDGFEEATFSISLLPGERATRSLELIALAVDASGDLGTPSPGRSILEEPAFWIVGGAILLVGAGVAIGVGVGVGSSQPAASYGGSTGVVLQALRF